MKGKIGRRPRVAVPHPDVGELRAGHDACVAVGRRQHLLKATDYRRYTVFGQVIRGLEVLEKITALPCDEYGNPLEQVTMKVTVKE